MWSSNGRERCYCCRSPWHFCHCKTGSGALNVKCPLFLALPRLWTLSSWVYFNHHTTQEVIMNSNEQFLNEIEYRFQTETGAEAEMRNWYAGFDGWPIKASYNTNKVISSCCRWYDESDEYKMSIWVTQFRWYTTTMKLLVSFQLQCATWKRNTWFLLARNSLKLDWW